MPTPVPTYELYGENSGKELDFWLHCETIRSRSSQHQWEIKPHRHASFFQILYIEAGSGDAIFGHAKSAICPPAVLTIPPGVSHGFRFSRDIEGLVITVLSSQLPQPVGDRGRLGEWFAAPHATTLDPQDIDAAYLMQTLDRLGIEFGQRRAGRSELLLSYISLALQLTARISDNTNVDKFASSENERRMEIVVGLVQQHFRSHQPASFYARALGVSHTHLNRIVRSETGQTMHELLANKLIDEAKRELLFTLGSVQEIAFRLGFTEPAYFFRFFSKSTGVTPRVWRQSAKAKFDKG
ncbi:helix-turn-helix domain-containing protein [Rhizobium herbae]|uniref:Helix-turn-helix domain-containing protein n=1 Tax=Rhizobium herbae TaxID=508661 RepID=A0ABS7HFE5_9HYPH|nr:helix-turn-helix domain-containing protein [Rhizobium herbae]MBW9066007.1 helix-turn-helix domain-containing protein [Rhizobium herbae]